MSWLGLILVAVAAYLIYADYPLPVRLAAIAAAAAFLLTGLIRDLPKPEKLRQWSAKRILLLTTVALFVMLNIVTRVFEKVWDLSQTRVYSLRQESVDWIAKIPSSVEIAIFLRSDDKTSKYVNWLRESAAPLGSKLTITVYNINRDVGLVAKYGVDRAGDAVMIAGDRWVKVSGFSETAIVQGLVRLFSRQGTAICFGVGHGEPDILSALPDGLADAAAGFQGIGYGTRSVSLSTASAADLESHCAMLAIIGPHSDFFPNELEILEQVLPKIPLWVAAGIDLPPAVAKLLAAQGVHFGGKLLVNPDNVARKVPVTDITVDAVSQGLSGLLYFPQVQALTLSEAAASGWSAAITTSPSQNIQEEGAPRSGPYVLAAIYQSDDRPRRIVTGSARSFINSGWRFGKNAELALLWARWLMADDALRLPATALVNEPLMDMTEAQVQWIKNGVFYGVPGLALAICCLVWWRHRR